MTKRLAGFLFVGLCLLFLLPAPARAQATGAMTGVVTDSSGGILPGVTAMHAAAARIGAPLGHDFCAISLSDNLKPWAVVVRRLEAAARYRPAPRSPACGSGGRAPGEHPRPRPSAR